MVELAQLGLQLWVRLGHGGEVQNGRAAIKWSEWAWAWAQWRRETCHDGRVWMWREDGVVCIEMSLAWVEDGPESIAELSRVNSAHTCRPGQEPV